MSTAPKRARCAAEPNAGDEDVSECSLTKAEKASVVELRSDGRPDVPDPWPHPRPVQVCVFEKFMPTRSPFVETS